MPALSSGMDAMMFAFDDNLPSFCASAAYPNADIWAKFDLPDCPTPPLSPERTSYSSAFIERTLSDKDDFTSSFLADPHTTSVEEFLNSNSSFGKMKTLPDLKNVCSEVFDIANNPRAEQATNNVYINGIKKDCMWNGRGQQPPCQVSRPRRNRSCSPRSMSGSPVIGCVDPRSVFNMEARNDYRKTTSQRRMISVEGLETPSDSEEEIDVVNVEKENSVKATTLGLVSDNGKFFGTLVQRKNGSRPHLALVTTNKSHLLSSKTNAKRQNATGQRLSVLMGNGKKATTGKQVSLQLVLNPSTHISTKRKLADNKSGAVLQVLRLTQKNDVMTESHTAQNVTAFQQSPPAAKRQVISLEGVSMVSNTGINRYRAEPSARQVKWINSDSTDAKSFIPTATTKKAKSITSATTEKRKTSRKLLKKSAATAPYDSPTCSPSSLNGEFPTSPGKRSGGCESSCSDEDQIRSQHNLLEKQRRETQRQAYNSLRNAVPELSAAERAPKVTILKKSREHILELRQENRLLQQEKLTLQQRHVALQQRLRKSAQELTSFSNLTITTSSQCIKKESPRQSLDKFAIFVN